MHGRERDSVIILLVDDDEADRAITRRALAQCGIESALRVVENGEQALEYLQHVGPFTDRTRSPEPHLILLDLNMPGASGLEVLEQLRQSDELKHIPVVLWTTSESEQDIRRAYELGANSYVVKPTNLQDCIARIRMLEAYWLDTVKLPAR